MHHDIFFADGDDDRLICKWSPRRKRRKTLPASDVLAALHRRRGPQQLEYRNHRVPNTSGLARSGPDSWQYRIDWQERPAGDRLIVYVTAHGSQGPNEKPFKHDHRLLE